MFRDGRPFQGGQIIPEIVRFCGRNHKVWQREFDDEHLRPQDHGAAVHQLLESHVTTPLDTVIAH